MTDFGHVPQELVQLTFDVMVIVSQESAPSVLEFAEKLRRGPSANRSATVLVLSNELSPSEAQSAGVDLVVSSASAVKDVIVHIAQAATRHMELNRLSRKRVAVS